MCRKHERHELLSRVRAVQLLIVNLVDYLAVHVEKDSYNVVLQACLRGALRDKDIEPRVDVDGDVDSRRPTS